mgnify:CR=1 FL=1|tara:strand:+ start:19526 stop:19744 length:219 start_codon:yes stop_codon:yes gene_type:complete
MASINFEDLFNWELENDKHYMSLLERHKQDEYEWQQWEEEERKKQLPAIVIFNPLIPTNEIQHKPLALRGTD